MCSNACSTGRFILEGLKSDDRVVTEGSFFLRAASLRINPSQ